MPEMDGAAFMKVIAADDKAPCASIRLTLSAACRRWLSLEHFLDAVGAGRDFELLRHVEAIHPAAGRRESGRRDDVMTQLRGRLARCGPPCRGTPSGRGDYHECAQKTRSMSPATTP
jgi:hypothetical protein